jgi:hypothetical protein
MVEREGAEEQYLFEHKKPTATQDARVRGGNTKEALPQRRTQGKGRPRRFPVILGLAAPRLVPVRHSSCPGPSMCPSHCPSSSIASTRDLPKRLARRAGVGAGSFVVVLSICHCVVALRFHPVSTCQCLR